MTKKKADKKTLKAQSSGHEQMNRSSKQSLNPGAGDGFRSLSSDSNRDLAPLSQDRMIQISYFLWRTNALAHWLIETNKDFILGNGVTVTADDADEGSELQELLDEFWSDPVNDFPGWMENQVRELAIYGEQCWPAFTNEHTGLVRLAVVDPAMIKDVVKDPDNARIAIGIELKPSAGAHVGRKIKIIYNAEDVDMFTKNTVLLREKFKDGECFFSKINAVSTSMRGASDTLHLTDWLDAYDQFLFDYAERSQLLGSFVWSVLMEGADQPTIDEFLKNNPPPKKGAVRVHNEKVTWSAVTPDLKSGDADAGARILRNHILGGAGMPEHYFGGGGDVNRATADSMGMPTFKRLIARQNKHKYMLENVIDYQITQAIKAGRLKGVKEPYAYTVNFPEMVVKDFTAIASTLSSLTTALSVAQQNGLIDKDIARKIFAVPAKLMGVEIDLCDVAENVAEEEEKAAAVDYFKEQAQALQARPPKRYRITKPPKFKAK